VRADDFSSSHASMALRRRLGERTIAAASGIVNTGNG
jgi:hypothetical protein